MAGCVFPSRMNRRRSRALVIAAAAAAFVVASCADDGSSQEDAGEPSSTTASATATERTIRTVPDVAREVDPELAALPLDTKIERFIDTPSSSLASAIAADMKADGDLRWGPWLLDLLRLGPSNLTDDDVADALAELSGIERGPDSFVIDDYRIYGSWVYDQAIDPGPGYRAWKIGLYGPIDDDYERLLSAVDDDLVLSRIQWGGVPRGGIPELNDPERVPAAAADWMEPDEVVFGATIDGTAVAYPFRILGHHELANDTIGETPVSLVFCTLCRTALLFDRRVDGQVLDFQTSGFLANSNKIMVDVQTDTLWSHLEGTGIAGELRDVTLEQFPLETTTWAEWTAAHPDTEVLAIPGPIFAPDPEQGAIGYAYEPDSPYQGYYDDPDVWFPILDTPTGDLGLKDEVLGLEVGDARLAVSVDAVVEAGPRLFVVGGRRFVVVPGEAVGARVYDGDGVAAIDDLIGEVGGVDGVTAVEIDIAESDTERAVLADGSTLPRLVVDQGLWFAWFANNPTTDWWPRG